MDRPLIARPERADGERRDAYVTIERRVGAPRLFATAYLTVGSSLYFALGVVAASALRLTPVVFLVASLLFVLGTPRRLCDDRAPRRRTAAVRDRLSHGRLVSLFCARRRRRVRAPPDAGRIPGRQPALRPGNAATPM